MEKFALGSFYASGVNIRVEHAQGEKAVLGVTSDYCRAILTAGREGVKLRLRLPASFTLRLGSATKIL